MNYLQKKINIAIDGFSSCGKSTLARDLAKALEYTYIDSGAMYRAVSLFFIRNNISPDNQEAVEAALEDINMDVSYSDGKFGIFLNGEDISALIIKPEISKIVSEVAAISSVRRKLVRIQQDLGKKKGIVMDGRDIGTVVFPDAEVKLFITADPDIRAERRYMELIEKKMSISLEDVKSNLLYRDQIDSTRADSPLIQAKSAVLIDNSYMSREEQLFLAMKIVENTLN